MSKEYKLCLHVLLGDSIADALLLSARICYSTMHGCFWKCSINWDFFQDFVFVFLVMYPFNSYMSWF